MTTLHHIAPHKTIITTLLFFALTTHVYYGITPHNYDNNTPHTMLHKMHPIVNSIQ